MTERDEEKAAAERYRRLVERAESEPLWHFGIEDVDPKADVPERYVRYIFIEEDPDPPPPSERELPMLDGDVTDEAQALFGILPTKPPRREISRLVPIEEYERVYGPQSSTRRVTTMITLLWPASWE